MTSQTINLDLIPKGIPPVIHVSQYDSGQEWTFMLFKDGIAYQIPSGAEVTIQGTKSDNTGFQYSCTYSGSQVVATETKQMTIFAGDVPAELVITKNSEQIGTLNFIIRVEPAALSDDTEISETDLPLLEEAIEAVAQVKGYSEDSEAYAVGTREGVPVGSSDPAYENNAKYYAENFVGMVTDAQYASIQSILT
jgi:hypothetical protein